MDPLDVERLYRGLSEIREEVQTGLGELRGEIHGYRADLNGRLRTLETAEASRSGAEQASSMSKGQVLGWGGFAIGIVSVSTAVITTILQQV